MLELLEWPSHRSTLPTTLTCPKCRARQFVGYRDPIFGGEWFHCRQCDDHGDIVDLAAGAWKLDRRAAALKLRQFPQTRVAGPDPLTLLEKDLLLAARRRRVDAFWQEARNPSAFMEDGNLHDLLEHYGIFRSLTAGNWTDTGGRLLGVSSHARIEETLRHGVHHRNAVLRGPDWGKVLTVPFYDLPGRICGMLFIGRTARPEDTVYYPLLKEAPDCGVGMLPGILNRVAADEDHVYHFADPQFGIRLQMRQLRSSQTYLPVVLTRPETTGFLWTSLAARQHIFCTPKLTEAVIRQARRLNGRVTVCQLPRAAELNRSPKHWLRHIRTKAQTWRRTLEAQLRTASLEQCDSIMLQTGFARQELQEFVRTCDRTLQQKLSRTLQEQTSFRQIDYRRTIITESSLGWSVSGRVVVGGTIRIEQIIKTERRQDYSGYVRIGEVTIPFRGPREEIQRDGLLVYAASVAEAAGHALVFDPAWNRHALRIAQFLHRPQVVLQTEKIGWNAELNGFHLAHFNLLAGGRMELGCSTPSPTVPTHSLLPPTGVLSQTINRLLKADQASHFFWAAFCCVLRHVLSPLHREAPEPTATLGRAAEAHFSVVADCAGCLTEPLDGNSKLAAEPQHHWPQVFKVEKDQKIDIGRLSSGFFLLPPNAGTTTAMCGWSTLRLPEDVLPLNVSLPALQTLLPQYLQDLCRRNLALTVPGTGFTEILADLEKWVHTTWVRQLDTAAVLEFYTPPSPQRRAAAFLQLLRPLIKNPDAVCVKGDHTLVRQAAVETLNFPFGAKPETFDATQLLQAGGLLGETAPAGFWAIRSEGWSGLQAT